MTKQLREEAMRLETEARAKLAEAQKDGTPADRAAALEAEFDALMDKRDGLVKKAERQDRADAAARDAEAHEEREARAAREGRRPDAARAGFAPETAAPDEYRGHFAALLAAGGDMSALSTEARDALRAGFVKPEGRAQSAATGAAGGYTVPTTLASFINIAMAAHGPMWDGAVASELVTPSGETITIPGVDDTAEEAAAHTAGADLADDASGDVTVTKEDLGSFTRSTPWIKWAFELAQDSGFSWEALLGRLIGERLGRTANRLLTVGTGTGEPLGFVPGAAVGKTAASNAAITFDEIFDLVHSVDPAYRAGPRVRFQMHDQSVKALRKIKDTTGNYLWKDGDVTKGLPPSLAGYPVSFNQAMDQIAASKKPIAFGDFGQYYVRKVGAPVIGVAREKFFPNIGIAGVARFDGAPGLAGAIKTLATPA
ncbi:phage major capsid protein [Defluviimonas sp. D31]|uniref:phage major capsid protein n=1 Tax=Defluviimonas sp. D31 TaxID=3083253 RepID=UPI00296FE556|nr:phage major capsid protein [Defluviimonas sp. D31]MDW4550877.1 phage major capsid protein [Defluviimonas sp. D31]